MESNTDFNKQVAQYTLCFNDQCPKAENCLRHSMTQYNTAENIRLSVINPLCYPEAGKECPHFRTNKKIRVAWGFKNLICPHVLPALSISIWKPFSAILPITGTVIRSWDSPRSSRSASAKYAGSMVGKRKLFSTDTPKNTTGRHSRRNPPTEPSIFSRMIVQFPSVGTRNTNRWYVLYLTMVHVVPQ